MQNFLNIAIKLVRANGSKIARVFDELTEENTKNIEFINQDIYEQTKEYLQTKFANVEVLNAKDLGEKNDLEEFWLVDAIDCEFNFINNIPSFLTSLVYIKNKIPQIAIAFNPITNELFSAYKGFGLKVNNSRKRKKPNSLQASSFAFYIDSKSSLDYKNKVLKLNPKFMNIVSSGSLLQDSIFVAINRYGALYFENLTSAQILQMELFLQESGSLIMANDASENYKDTKNILVAHPSKIKELF